MPIPAKPTRPVDTLTTRASLLFGEPGIGKSTLCADIPRSIILATERGLDQLTAMRWEYADGSYVIKTWDDLILATKEALASGRFGTLVIDNLTGLCWLAERHVLNKHGQEHLSDGNLGYGVGAKLVGNLIRLYLNSLSVIRVGVWIIAHQATETIEARTGSYDRFIPSVPNDNKRRELLNIILGAMDMVLYACTTMIEKDGVKTPHRVLRTQPSQEFVAKCRGEKGAPPMMDPVPLAWAKLEQAYGLTQVQQSTAPTTAPAAAPEAKAEAATPAKGAAK